jgi:hypothetical protein
VAARLPQSSVASVMIHSFSPSEVRWAERIREPSIKARSFACRPPHRDRPIARRPYDTEGDTELSARHDTLESPRVERGFRPS